MEPNHNSQYSPGTELPQLGQSEGQVYPHEKVISSPEAIGQPAPITSTVAATPPVSSQPVASLGTAVPAYGLAGLPTTSAVTATLTADDADLIEKEWVLKAKAIVMETKDDPRSQSLKMSGVKADYLKKRYNKDLKVSES